jgi:hypothetical protein
MKSLSVGTLQQLRDYLYQEAYDASMDDAHHFIRDVLLDGYKFPGYRHMSQEELLQELCDELEVDDIMAVDPSAGYAAYLAPLIHQLQTELE